MIRGNVIRERREKLNMTQEELANACGYREKSVICKIEKGQPIDIPVSKALKIAGALGLGLMEIVEG